MKASGSTTQIVERMMESPACLRGRAWARREAASVCEPGTDDYRFNMQEAARLEQLIDRQEGRANDAPRA